MQSPLEKRADLNLAQRKKRLAVRMERKEAVLESIPPLKECPSYPGYWATEEGHVYSLKGRTVPLRLTGCLNKDGYYRVGIRVEGRLTVIPIHRIISDAFLGKKAKGLVTRHLNGDPKDNRATNLAYGTDKENKQDQLIHRGLEPFLKSARKRRKLTWEQASEIRALQGKLSCLKVGALFKIHESTVCDIWNKKLYALP